MVQPRKKYYQNKTFFFDKLNMCEIPAENQTPNLGLNKIKKRSVVYREMNLVLNLMGFTNFKDMGKLTNCCSTSLTKSTVKD